MARFLLFLALFASISSLSAQNRKDMYQLSNWDDNSYPVVNGEAYSDCWGYAANNREYAILGSLQKVHIFDVTNPASPNLVFTHAPGNTTEWREFKTYQNWLYAICDNCSEGLQIYNLAGLPNNAVLDTSITSYFIRAHMLFVDTLNAKLYITGSNTRNNGLIIFNIANPDHPVQIFNGALPGGYVHDCYVRNDTIYCSHGNNGLYVYKLNSNNTMTTLGSLTTYIEQGYNHSSWLTPDGHTLVMADETHNKKVKTVNVSNLTDITVLDTFYSAHTSPYSGSIAHNPYIIGNYAYLSYYHDGVVVFDISNPSSVGAPVAWFDTDTTNTDYAGYRGAWGIYPYLPSGNIVASDLLNGLFMVKWCDANSCTVPSGLTATNITSTKAKLSWNSQPCATRYRVRYRVKGTTAWTNKWVNIPSTSLSLVNLLPNKIYQWQIQTICSGYSSAFSSIKTFKTLPAAIAPGSWEAKVDPVLLSHLEEGGQAIEMMILLNEQTDLSKASQLHDKTSKGRYVFEHLQATALRTQRGVIQLLEENHAPYRSHFVVNAVYAAGNQELVRQLAELPEVKQIVANSPYHVEEPVESRPATLRGPDELSWGVQMIKADSVWLLGYQGEGVVVAGHDTGIDWTHPAIQHQYRGWNNGVTDHNYNWHDAIHQPADTTLTNPCGYDLHSPCDDNSHGTHTVGTMVGSDDVSQFGVAPRATWIGVRNMNQGNGTLESYVEGFEWFIAPTDLLGQNPDPAKAPHVINNSWYCSTGEGCNESNFAVMDTAVQHTRDAGIVVVVSAGNSGAQCSTVDGPPAFMAPSFSVGATDSNDSIAGFSSRGPVLIDGSGRLKPEISAPGVSVYSCTPDGTYGYKSGTSMAGPHVAGVVALMISANPQLAGEVDAIEEIIKATAKRLYSSQTCGDLPGDQYPNNTFGYGRIDAYAAVQAALQWSLSGTATPADQPEIRVSPNPFRDNLIIEGEHLHGEVRIELYNTEGQLMYHDHSTVSDYQLWQLPLGNLPSGVYLYRVVSGGYSHSGKVIKVH